MAFTLPKTLVANTPENVNDLNSNLNYLLGVPFTSSGQSFNAGPGTRTNVAYGALGDAADQVTGITIPAAGGLIAVWFQATWQESVSGAARAAIFLGANQVKLTDAIGGGGSSPMVAEAITNSAVAGRAFSLASSFVGLQSSTNGTGYSGDVTTGQIIGTAAIAAFSTGTTYATQSFAGGPCYIFAAAGTYTVSVQYKASSGTVTASNRRLYVAGMTF